MSCWPGGVIGSHAGLRSLCRKACRFKSDPGHFLSNQHDLLNEIAGIAHPELLVGRLGSCVLALNV